MRWLKRIGLGLLVAIVALVAVVYAGSEYLIRRDRGVPPGTIVADRSPAGLVEGQRLARINGCYSCHGTSGHGVVMVKLPAVITITAPPLSLAAAGSDGELSRTLQHAVSRDGRALWIMPAHPRMAESDIAMIMGHLRTVQPSPADIARQRSFGPIGRALLLAGKIEPSTRPGGQAPKTRPAALGAYLVDTICMGCHELDRPKPFEGPGNQVAPALAPVAAAYDDAAFVRLLRTGYGVSKPGKLGIMTEVGQTATHYLRDDEIAAIHAFLKQQAAALPAH